MVPQAVVILCCLIGASSAFWDWGPAKHWDGLKVTWSINPLNSNRFDHLPRTTAEADSDGWFGGTRCSTESGALFRGRQYILDDDISTILLFDKNGYIAGIQTQVPPGAAHNYPAEGLVPPFVFDGAQYTMTVYFTNPATICTTGRTQEDFDRDGTGTDLYIQTGPNPDTDVMKIPLNEADLAGTKWVEGKCFWSMGKHYWYDISDDMSCDKFYPVFLLYNKERLNAFGWGLSTSLEGPRYEHPTADRFGLFMKSVPKCLATRGEISTMHVFLTNSPFFYNRC